MLAAGLEEIEERIPIEQDSSAIWDDAVLNLRENNDAWLAENLAEWVSEYFAHDRVYILGPNDEPMRAVRYGTKQPLSAFEFDRAAVAPLVEELRAEMQAASIGLTESTPAITGLGILDRVPLSDGSVAIVSIRPVVPGDATAVPQAPGTEFLHVSIKQIDQSVTDAIAEHFGIDNVYFETAPILGPDQASIPVLNSAGSKVGELVWTPFRPALQMLVETLPVMVLTAVFIVIALTLLLFRLQRTAARLELSEAEALYLAYHDPLSRIPNRALFEDRLERAIAEHRKSGIKLALHMIDLDRFKTINDTLGHPSGDELIRTVAMRLSSLISEADTVARLGGDEFAIIQVNVTRIEDSLHLGDLILEELSRPFDLHGHEVSISASVGIVCCGELKDDAADLVRKADIALYEAKASGRNRVEVFAGELDQIVRERRSIEIDLRTALHDGTGLNLVYQPIFSSQSARILGAEALVRWDHPTKGRLSPDVFINIAEERGLIDNLGLWVLREAIGFVKHSTLPWVAVNVSPVQFRDPRFADEVFALLKDLAVTPERLELEITEGLLLQNSQSVQHTLRRLRQHGIRVALDDFGTGYSSISYLRTYGVDKLKIDQSFVAQMGIDMEVDSIVRSIIDLARAMRMKVTAEGVETEQQRTALTDLACDQLQGYLLSRPVTADRLEELIEEADWAKAG
nr:bifunctional diguanylate cyclase/phosphodiesterase [Devosia ureilytica]